MQTLSGLAGFYERVESQVLDNGSPNIDEATEAVTLQKLRERLQEIGDLVEG